VQVSRVKRRCVFRCRMNSCRLPGQWMSARAAVPPSGSQSVSVNVFAICHGEDLLASINSIIFYLRSPSQYCFHKTVAITSLFYASTLFYCLLHKQKSFVYCG
jgi:hypothetical protein